MKKTFNHIGRYDNSTYEVEFKSKQITSDDEIISLLNKYNFVVQYWERQADRTPVEIKNREIKKKLLENHNIISFTTI